MSELTGITGNYYNTPYSAVSAGRRAGKNEGAKKAAEPERTVSSDSASGAAQHAGGSARLTRDALEQVRKSITGAGSFTVLTATENAEIGGKAIGDVKLSKEGQKYYDQLRAKFGNMDFILVSEDKKEAARAQASRFSSPGKMTVLIDEAKIEKMAADPEYRDKYEGIIAMAQMQLPRIQDTMSSMGLPKADSFGVSVGGKGEMNYFAVMKENTEKTKELAAKRAEKRKEAKKAEKKAAEKAAGDKAEARKAEKAKAADQAEKTEKADAAEVEEGEEPVSNGDGTVTIHASSLEELLQRMIDYAGKADGEAGGYQHIDMQA